MLKALLSHSVNEVNVKEVIGDTTIVFLDAREKREYEVSHIKTAKWVGYDDFKMKRVDAIPKNKKVVVYCSVGYRSEKIAEKLMESGYTEVSNLYGGIFEWKNQENPVYNKNGEMEKIHAYDKTWGIWLNKGEKVYK
ncbi:MAG: rhodanese [Flavobacteriales bacterium]|nr:MAG: rhodanese [Flavobacteriales bacterium]